jgi:predicted molibdopterin-dependent oxidoreductase YjgC
MQGRQVEGRPGETVLDVARRHDLDIPTLCHHDLLVPYGACRVCLVEVSRRGRPAKLAAACTHPAQDGLVVELNSPRVERARRVALELLLAHAPEAPAVVALAARYGAEKTRFSRVEQPWDCILCGLCERVCRDVVGASAIGLAGRGATRRVDPPFGDESHCIGCGACDSLCPTGVLHMRERALARLRNLPGDERQCRYSLMGLLPGALCANDYRCERCETEQVMVDRDVDHPALRVRFAPEREVVR